MMVPMHLAAQAFFIFTEELATINIRTVARKSHILVAADRVTQLLLRYKYTRTVFQFWAQLWEMKTVLAIF